MGLTEFLVLEGVGRALSVLLVPVTALDAGLSSTVVMAFSSLSTGAWGLILLAYGECLAAVQRFNEVLVYCFHQPFDVLGRLHQGAVAV